MGVQVDSAMALDEYNTNGQDGLDDLLAILDADQVWFLKQTWYSAACQPTRLKQQAWELGLQHSWADWLVQAVSLLCCRAPSHQSGLCGDNAMWQLHLTFSLRLVIRSGWLP